MGWWALAPAVVVKSHRFSLGTPLLHSSRAALPSRHRGHGRRVPCGSSQSRGRTPQSMLLSADRRSPQSGCPVGGRLLRVSQCLGGSSRHPEFTSWGGESHFKSRCRWVALYGLRARFPRPVCSQTPAPGTSRNEGDLLAMGNWGPGPRGPLAGGGGIHSCVPAPGVWQVHLVSRS